MRLASVHQAGGARAAPAGAAPRAHPRAPPALPWALGAPGLPPRSAAPARRGAAAVAAGASADAAAAAGAAPAAAARAAPAAFPPPLPPLDAGYEAACAFTDFANWLIPGPLMLGRYPFVEPARCRGVAQGQAQLEQIVAAGLTTFVCLQAELPPQADLRLAGVDGFLPYRATAELVAAAASDPPSLEEMGQLRTPDLDRFLPPRRARPGGGAVAAAGPAGAAWTARRRVTLDFAHCPIVDLGLPGEAQLDALLADLEARLRAGERLYVHCWGGRGRAGTVGATLLARLYGLGADEALERTQRAYDTRRDSGGNRRSPETDEQRAFVRRFIEARM